MTPSPVRETRGADTSAGKLLTNRTLRAEARQVNAPQRSATEVRALQVLAPEQLGRAALEHDLPGR